ncbi:MAG: DNA polymerase III subunit delta [Chloroflexi bacterium]|nr:DNA polymerase III subunit delta [Chloroflexota bacterium]
MLYLVTGRDEFRREQFVDQLKALMLRLPDGEHNIDELNSGNSTAELITLCNTTPFLCEKRMVIARGMGSTFRKGGGLAQLCEYLPHLPPTTHLVVVEDEESTVQALAAARDDAVRRQSPRLRPGEMPQWVTERARSHQARISAPAAKQLAELVGPDLRLLDHEIEKLAAFAAVGASISIEDVAALVHGASPDIFAWHDALAEGKAGQALASTRGLINRGSEPAELFAQIVALVRRLFITKQLIEENRSLAREATSFGLTSSSFAQDKLKRQAARLSTAQLERVYQALAQLDVQTKTGRIEAELAVDLAVAQLVGIDPATMPDLEESL